MCSAGEGKEPFDCHTQKLICSCTPTQGSVSSKCRWRRGWVKGWEGWKGGCRGKGGLIESKSRHFTVGCMCMFVVRPLLREANTPPRSYIRNQYWGIRCMFRKIKKDIVLAKDLTATYCCPHCFFSFRRRYSRSHRCSRVYQTLHHFTQPSWEITWPAMLTHLAVLILCALHFHQLPAHKKKTQEENWRDKEARGGVQRELCRRMGLSLLALDVAFTESVAWISGSASSAP